MKSSTKLIIAVDGYSSCGKSTIAKQLANHLGYIYVDTGAMYRAVSLFFLRNNVNLDDIDQVEESLDKIDIKFKLIDCLQIVHLNDEPVENLIRKSEINDIVSHVAKISAVRTKLVKIQRSLGHDTSIVMDGRDIGTVVFPDADIKFFITSKPETRVQRRYDELLSKGFIASKDEIRKNLEMRDLIDSTRKDSPLRQAKDAILIDNSNMTKEEQLEYLLNIINDTINNG